MNNQDGFTNGPTRFGATRRKAISLSQGSLIKFEALKADQKTPLLISPSIDGVNLLEWATNNRETIETNLIEHGALLFRGFKIREVASFEQFVRTIAGELLEYSYRSTPRSKVEGNIYTSTEYPADQQIPLHNEMSYSRQWPMKIGFFSLIAAQEGGETPIADARKVFERISPRVREKFMQKNVMYMRNYGPGLDLPWQNVFQTSDRSEVEAFCKNKGIEYEWIDDDGLRTRQVCQAVTAHPTTGEMVWFNQAHLFHVSSLAPEIAKALVSNLKQEDLPRNAYYGDGSPIELAAIEEVREAYQKESIIFPWQEGDIMFLDNVLMAHGRTSFKGPRKVVVGMAQPFEG